MTNREAHEAAYERRTSALATKHDPECDCGICQYCNGSEDKFGNPTKRSDMEIGNIRRAIKMLMVIECSECDEAKTGPLQSMDFAPLAQERLEFSKTAWKYGWIVEADKVLCPNCRADAEEWRSI